MVPQSAAFFTQLQNLRKPLKEGLIFKLVFHKPMAPSGTALLDK